MKEKPKMPTRTYSAVVVTRLPERQRTLREGNFSETDQLATCEASWRMSLDRAERTDFLLIECDGLIVDAARVLGAERIASRHAQLRPHLDGRVRFITSHHLPPFIERMIGQPMGRNRNPVHHVVLNHDLVADTVTVGSETLRSAG